MTSMRVSDAFPSKFLKADDLKGQTAQLTIDHVEMDDVGDDRKPIAYFQGAKKGLVLNVTNARAIAALAGDDMNAWGGMPIELFSTPVSYQGRMVDAIRVRPLDPVHAKKTAPDLTPAPNAIDPNDPLPMDL